MRAALAFYNQVLDFEPVDGDDTLTESVQMATKALLLGLPVSHRDPSSLLG
jgi:hypothetical protein